MSINDIITGGGIVLVVILTLIQVTPIKINPWSWIWRKIKKGMSILGKDVNGEILEEISNLKNEMSAVKADVAAVQQKVDAMSEAYDEQAAITARSRILRFGDEVLHGQMHTKDHFDSILKDARMYEQYCETHKNFENGVTEPTIKRIKDVYRDALKKNSFL